MLITLKKSKLAIFIENLCLSKRRFPGSCLSKWQAGRDLDKSLILLYLPRSCQAEHIWFANYLCCSATCKLFIIVLASRASGCHLDTQMTKTFKNHQDIQNFLCLKCQLYIFHLNTISLALNEDSMSYFNK